MSNEKQADTGVDGARRAAKVDVIPAERQQREETAAFDVAVKGMGLIGRWAQIEGGSGMVTWVDGSHALTGGCDADPARIVEAVRSSIPIRVESEDGPTTRRGRILRRLPGLG